jgi:hypothetical protein
MEPESYPDPIREAIGHGMNRVVQVASSVVTAAQVLVYLSRDYVNARRENGRAAALALTGQLRAEHTATGVGRAAVRDPSWLDNADLSSTIQAWGAMMPYADWSLPWHHHAAGAAMRKAEERLRVLHPTAMARYDMLRSEGTDPASAMIQAAPLFGYPADGHEAPSAPAQRTLAIGGTVTADPSGNAQADATAAAAVPPWQQDFPWPIGEVLAATASTDTTSPHLDMPKVPAPETHRAPRAGRQS